jgi:hypothetical protein
LRLLRLLTVDISDTSEGKYNFCKLVQKKMIKKGHNRVHKLPFMRDGGGGLHGFQRFPARLDGIVQNQRSMVDRGATTIADQDKMV